MSEIDIHEACKNGDMDRVKTLVAADTIVNDKDRNGETLLYLSVKGDMDKAKTLVTASTSVNDKVRNGETPLYLSVQGDHIDIVRFLLGKGADPNTRNGEEQRSPLIAASEHGYTHLVECLLDHKAVVNQGNRYSCTPLWHAASEDHKETVELLLSRGAHINQASDYGSTPLYKACLCGRYNTAALLLQHWADADICDMHGRSPLHIAVFCHNKNIVQLLLQHGVRIVKNGNGETPLDVAHRRMQRLDPEHSKNTGRITDYTAIIPMLKNYTAGQELEDGSAAQSDQIMFKALSDQNLMKLAKEMTSDWQVIGGFLGVKHSDIKQLAMEYKSDQRFAAWSMLVSWRDSTGGRVRDKIQTLKVVLLDVDHQDIADML